MLDFLLEVAISAIICGVLAYFLLLSDPIDDSADFEAGDEGNEDHPHSENEVGERELYSSITQLPYYDVLSTYIDLTEDHWIAKVYSWVAAWVHRYVSRRTMSRHTVARRGSATDVGNGKGDRGAMSVFSTSGRRGRDRLAKRNIARRQRRGRGLEATSGIPSPRRSEAAQWTNILLRWVAVLYLGGGSLKHEVWVDRLQYAISSAITAANSKYDTYLGERRAGVQGNKKERGQGARQSTGWYERGPSLHSPKPLLRLMYLDVGSGLLGGSTSGPLAGIVGGGSISSGGIAASMAPVSSSSFQGSGGPPATTSLAAGGTSVFSTVGDTGQALAMPVNSVRGGVTTGDTGAAGSGIEALDYLSTSSGGGGGIAMGISTSVSVGSHLGAVLPRISDDIVSTEIPKYPLGTPSIPSGEGAATTPVSATSTYPSCTAPTGSTTSIPRPTISLRCFLVPLLYEDQRFLVRLSCSFPLCALLPAQWCIAPDVLTLDCGVAIRRIIFHGSLHAAFCGSRLELSFPCVPHFTAAIDVAATAPKLPVTGSVRARDWDGSGNVLARQQQQQQQSPGPQDTLREHPSNRHLGRPPLPPAPKVRSASGAALPNPAASSAVTEKNEKVEEIVLLAVHRLIRSLTYPNVLEGRLVPEIGEDKTCRLKMKWQRRSASLPLHT